MKFRFIRKFGKIIPIPLDPTAKDALDVLRQMKNVLKTSNSAYLRNHATIKISEILAKARSV